ncbi:MAG: BtpA/SgcQ family protein [Synergistaceae bacterium]|jgi:membrane complex biogenesis BtpA family protein|nr:BtpA/SgcQ family protein [Synergistaceae bacterium]
MAETSADILADILMEEIFGVKKPVMGMVHFLPLPGSPLYDAAGGVKKIRDAAMKDAEALVAAGFDGLSFSNEGDRPYLSDVDKTTVAVMSSVISEVASHFRKPFGLSVLADPEAAIAIGSATGANYVRIFLSWVFVSDWGIVDPCAGGLQRFRRNCGGMGLRVFANISGHTEPLGGRKLKDIAAGAVKFGLADAVCLAGTTAGSPIAGKDLQQAKEGAQNAPVIAGTGVSLENVDEMMRLSDGVIVGTSVKIDGDTFNLVDAARAKRFMDRAAEVRATLASCGLHDRELEKEAARP